MRAALVGLAALDKLVLARYCFQHRLLLVRAHFSPLFPLERTASTDVTLLAFNLSRLSNSANRSSLSSTRARKLFCPFSLSTIVTEAAMASAGDARLLKSTKFPPEFSQKVDMQKVNLQVIKKFVTGPNKAYRGPPELQY